LEKFAADNPSAAAAVAAKYFAGIGYVRSGQPQKAVRIYELLVREQTDPRLADNVAFGYGLAEFAQGNFREADRILRRFASQHIDSEVIDAAIFFAAASRFERGLIADADAEFLNFAGLFASSSLYAHALLFAGLCEEKLNHPENALILYERASESGISQNSCLVATAGRAAASMAMGDTERALALLALMAEEQRGNAAGEAALFWTGRLLYASGQWNEAQAALEEFTKAYPASPLADDAFFFSARAARTETDYPAAVRLFRALNSQYQESVFAERSVVESAECMLEAGEALDAARTFKEFIDNNVASPLRPLALYNMGKALQRTGKYVEAIEQFKAAAGGETNELAAGSHFAIAECLSELDRSGEAVAVLVGMVGGAYPPDWAERAQLQVARLLERDGQVDEARHVYASIVQTYQRDAAGIVAKRALDRLKIEKVVSAQ
jgi:TolA-binding protein